MASPSQSQRIIDLAVPDLSGNERRYLEQCIDTTFVSSVGPFVNRFEEAVAAATGAPSCIATASGTAGLHAALVAVGVRPGDLVVLPAFTFIASANAISQCGAQPWLMDVEQSSWNLDPELLSQQLARETRSAASGLIHIKTGRRVAALLPVYALGEPADMESIARIARTYRLPVVADAAAALGSLVQGRPLAQSGAYLSVLSFNGNKTVTCGGGGGVIGVDGDLCRRVRHLCTTARVGEDYDHDVAGFNYRMTNLQAAVGCAQIERLESFVAAKRAIRASYAAAFAGTRTSPFPSASPADSACWLSGVVTEDSKTSDALRRALVAAGIKARRFWKPMHLQAPYRDAPATPQPVTDALWERIVVLPSSSNLTEADLERVIDVTRSVLQTSKVA